MGIRMIAPGRRHALVVGAALILGIGSSAHAQITAPAPSGASGSNSTTAQSQTGHRWELEGHVGVAIGRLPAGGSTTLPDPGAPLTSTNPTFPARRTSTWFLGDGAAMFNDAAAELGVAARISSLDAALVSLGQGSTAGASFGLRARRGLTPRLSAEVSLDVMTGSADLPEELVSAAEAGRESFERAFSELVASGPFSNGVVSATTTAGGGSSREVVLTGALSMRLSSTGTVVPYLTVGGGLVTGAADGESLTLDGHYRGVVAGVPIDETDRMTLRYGHATSFVVVAGAGVRRDLSDRWAFRIDGRVFIGANNTRLLLDAAPSVARGTPSGFIETFTYPNLQFSNDPSTGRESTLSGAPLDGFEAFRGEGIRTRILFAVGVVRRF
jgi:uncharacterized protein (UPF0548 family)